MEQIGPDQQYIPAVLSPIILSKCPKPKPIPKPSRTGYLEHRPEQQTSAQREKTKSQCTSFFFYFSETNENHQPVACPCPVPAGCTLLPRLCSARAVISVIRSTHAPSIDQDMETASYLPIPVALPSCTTRVERCHGSWHIGTGLRTGLASRLAACMELGAHGMGRATTTASVLMTTMH